MTLRAPFQAIKRPAYVKTGDAYLANAGEPSSNSLLYALGLAALAAIALVYTVKTGG